VTVKEVAQGVLCFFQTLAILHLFTTKLMLYQITNIEFDFDDEDYLDEEYKSDLIDEAVSQIWEASDEDDLVEEITTAYGWCIKSINYRHILS